MQANTYSLEDIRKDFPVLNRRVRDDKKLVYLDNAATTQKPNQVIDAITDYYQNHNSNIHRAVHALAEESTEGRVVEKSILKNKSKSLFKGMIKINENAAHSNSFLSGRSILLDKDAKSDAIPGLEILTNDVKATHSASVAQMDEEQIFYMGTRCLSRAESERIIVEGFLEPMSRSMSYQVRAWIAYLIESKWEGKELSINNDEQLKSIVEVEETRYNENAEIEQHYKYR